MADDQTLNGVHAEENRRNQEQTVERVTVEGNITQVGGSVHVTVKPGVVEQFLKILRRRSGEPAPPPPPRPPIVAKGLRSFDEHDADFFLALLPGARDLSGLPQSIRFWKTRFEETDPNRKFRIGLLYGPSGCGKSSLMKAGILPRLADSVIPIYVEATAEDTEARMLRGLRRYCQELPPKSGLVATLQQKKRIPEGKTLVIILDQFEQWLYDKQDFGSAELTQALAECDGEKIQCVLMVRDDFWTPVTRFLRHLETKQEEGKNMAMVDLFDLSHAKKVLAIFGTALGTLDQSEPLPKQQQAFVDKVVEGIAQRGKVICVRLALFVEMLHAQADPGEHANAGQDQCDSPRHTAVPWATVRPGLKPKRQHADDDQPGTDYKKRHAHPGHDHNRFSTATFGEFSNQSFHLVQAVRVANRFHRRRVQRMRDAGEIARFEGVAPTLDHEFSVGNPIVERTKNAAVVPFGNAQVSVQVEDQCRFLFGELPGLQCFGQHISEELADLPVVRFHNADGEACKQGRLVEEDDALTAVGGEDLSVPIADGRCPGVVCVHRRIVKFRQELGCAAD